jgi:hypothetical protein
MYLSHHGGATCTEADPLCRVCPLTRQFPAFQISDFRVQIES